MKKVLLITTGGTIASQQTQKGLSPQINAQGLLAYTPEIADKYEIHAIEIMNIESSDLKPEQWLLMVKALEDNYAKYDGFVITHGTDTLAYTAAALSYLVQNSAKTIVITGSQYPISDNVTDAKRNLIDSCRFAADSDLPGVYVVFNGKAMFGNRVQKVRTKNFEAFDSINYPDAAVINDCLISKYCIPAKPSKEVKFYYELNPSVLLLKFYPGVKPETYQALGGNFKAIIMESYGVGGIPSDFLPLIEQWYNQGKIMVVCTQVLNEGTDLEVYTVGNTVSKKFHLLQSYEMTTEAVLAKLMFALGLTEDKNQIQEFFYEDIQSGI